MKYAVKTYGLAAGGKSEILAIMAQWKIREIEFTSSDKKRQVNLKTVLPGRGVITGAMAIEIAPVEDFQAAVLEISRSFPNAIVACRTIQGKSLALAVNGRLRHHDLVEFMEEK